MAELIQDGAALARAVERLVGRPVLACDLETTGLDPHRDEVLLVQVGDDRYQIAVDARKVTDLSPLQAVLERDGITVFHNAQFDLKFLKKVGLTVSRPQDTMMLETLLAGGRRVGARTLKACSERRVGLSLDKAVRSSFERMEGELTEAQIDYAIDDVLATYHLFLEQSREIEREGMQLAAQIEGAATLAFADLEYHGINLDRPAWEAILERAQVARDEARGKLEKALLPVVGGDLFGNVNVNYESESELRDVFARLGFPDLPGLDKETLGGLDHPVARELLIYRNHQKTLSSYGEGFLAHIHPVTGRLHPRFRQIGAATGRASCDSPNLQNVKKGEGFREAFCAPPGRKMITADYATCELRILAQLSLDPAFLRSFEKGEDLHSAVATELFGKTVTKETEPELRNRAKAINFGLVYGMGAGGLASSLGISRNEAEKLLEGYFEKFPRVKRYLEGSVREALQRGHCETLSGRRLYLDGASEPEKRPHLERVARNMPVQGASADITKLAMARLTRHYQREGIDAFLVNTIHDELLVEVDADRAEEAARVLEQEMVAAGDRFLPKVPTVVDVMVSDHWSK
ncbi:MAG: DNA polymerase [Deltaproteobacteria bacterium]|nr:DNA polymerase [Deltaproteobacteria bacterium]